MNDLLVILNAVGLLMIGAGGAMIWLGSRTERHGRG